MQITQEVWSACPRKGKTHQDHINCQDLPSQRCVAWSGDNLVAFSPSEGLVKRWAKVNNIFTNWTKVLAVAILFTLCMQISPKATWRWKLPTNPPSRCWNGPRYPCPPSCCRLITLKLCAYGKWRCAEQSLAHIYFALGTRHNLGTGKVVWSRVCNRPSMVEPSDQGAICAAVGLLTPLSIYPPLICFSQTISTLPPMTPLKRPSLRNSQVW